VAASKVEVFSFLHFDGRRFENHSLPLSVVGELGLYEKAVLHASRFLFFDANRNRRRVPLDVQLFASAIDEGSALIQIDRLLPEFEGLHPPTPQRDLFPREGEKGRSEYLHEGRELLLDFIHSGGHIKSVDKALTGVAGPNGAASFNMISSVVGLGDSLDEADELGIRQPDSKKDNVTLTRGFTEDLRVRYRMNREEVPKEMSLIGSVRMADVDRNSYNMLLEDGRRVRIDAPPMFFQKLKRSLNSENQKPVWVEVRGIGQYRRRKLFRLNATDVRPLWRIILKETPTSSLSEQLKVLGALEEGWGEYGDEPAIAEGTLKLCRAVLRGIEQEFGVPTPYLYPTTRGVQAEWPGQRWNAALEITEDSLKLILIPVKGAETNGGASSVHKFEPASFSALGELLAERLSEVE